MKTNYEKAVRVCIDGGMSAVFEAVNDGFLTHDGYHHCGPCECETPHERNICLVCGTTNLPQPDQNQALDHTIFFERADDLWQWLEENQLTDPVTLTIHLGTK